MKVRFSHRLSVVPRNSIDVRIGGHVSIVSGEFALEGKNTISRQYINYLYSALQGNEYAPVSVYIVLQPTGTQVPLNSFVYQNNSIQFKFSAQSTPQITSIDMYVATPTGAFKIASYTPSNTIAQSGLPLVVQWTINFDITYSFTSTAQVQVNSTNLANILAYFTAPFQQPYTTQKLNVTPSPPQIQLTPSPVTLSTGAFVVAYYALNQTVQVSGSVTYDGLQVLSFNAVLTPPQGQTGVGVLSFGVNIQGD